MPSALKQEHVADHQDGQTKLESLHFLAVNQNQLGGGVGSYQLKLPGPWLF